MKKDLITRELNSALVYSKGGTTTASKIIAFIKLDTIGTPTNTKKFKFSYRSGNAFEEFEIEKFDGDKLNPIADLRDLGVKPDMHAYNILDQFDHKARIEMIMVKGIEYITNLIS